MMPNNQDIDYASYLSQIAASQTEAIAAHTLPNGETIWVRKASQHNAMWRYWLLGAVIKPLKLGVLTPVPSLGGEAAIAIEAQRLRALASANVCVPQLLAAQENALMMSDLAGEVLETQIANEAQQQQLDSWTMGLHALADVHAKNQFLSQAFARNMNISGSLIGFLDFEDDPSSVLNLPQCQCRDWLCYLHSTALTLKKQGLISQALTIWQTILSKQPVEIQHLLQQTVKPVRGLRVLQHPRWGRDALRLSALMMLFS